MDFDEAKENIQPLAQGRNASILHASLRVESSQELQAQRKELEKEIHNYSGDDPLSVWYNYIDWIEQSFPSGGKESGLQEVLSKCLSKFESDEMYKQDRRMIKLYIKFIDSHKDPAECYQQLFNAGIGTMVADLYIAWAYCYDLVGNTRKADEVFRRGIACRAQPLDELQEAHQHFGFSVAQRLMYKDDDTVKEETNRQLYERRLALTSLRGHRRKQLVGSIRTGSAVKSTMPGTIKIDQPSTSSQRGNARVQVFKDENESPNVITTATLDPPAEEISVVRSIIDAARNQENEKEPGPWNKAHNRKKGKLFGKTTITNELGFEIHVDDQNDEDHKKPCVPPIPIAESEIKFGKPFIYPTNFCAKSNPIKGWATPVTTEEMPDKNTIPQYNKCKLYPRPNMEFQLEELKAYYILKKRATTNKFTNERDVYWGCGPNYNIRLYPHFAKQSKPRKNDAMDEPYIPDNLPGLKVPYNEIYNKEEKVERQYEEILALGIKRNETIIKTTDMEETMCTTSEKVQRRKSFFPLRKSLATSAFRAPNRMSVMPEQSEIDEKTKTNESLSVPSVCSMEDGIKTVPAEISASIKEIPIIPKIAVIKEKTPTISIPKQSEIPLLTIVNTEKVANEPVMSKPFEIFKDDSVIEVINNKSPTLQGKTIGPGEDDFKFKTPALPMANSTTVATAANKKLQFEIFDDENLLKNSPKSMPKPDFSCGTGGFFDPEETCSTQTFNIFLKAQSVSTPKATTKSQPQRQFGNILKEVTTPTVSETKDDTTPAENQNYTAAAAPPAVYSPPRQQLSTILETSEHGTTQGTHTTGATTKSTLSSPEFDIDSQMQSTNVINQPQIALETVKELSCEASNVISPTQSVDQMMTSLKIQNVTDINSTRPQSENRATPGPTRLQKKYAYAGGGLDFSIFEDTTDKNQKQVGNFSRLEEKEDTAADCVFKTLPPIRFQDDKTETIPKMLLTSQQVKFQDDKTETISKLLFAPPPPIQFQEDKTETISKMLLGPPQPIKFPEDKTETISKFMLAPPEPIKFEDEKIEPKLTNIEKNQPEPMNQDDSFEFFGHTPPKAAKQLVSKQISHVRTAADNRTPLTFDSKRFCDKDTPVMQKSKSHTNPTVLFEDETPPHMKSLNKPTTTNKNNLKDSFLPDFSLIEDSQPQTNKVKQPTKSKSVFRDSFIPDFSLIEDSQPQAKEMATIQHKTITESILPEFSLIENTQPKQGKSTQSHLRNASYLSDFSHVPETQPNDSIIISSQPIEPRFLKQTSMKSSLQSSFQKDFSKTIIVENKVDENIHWKQTPKPKSVANRTQDGTTLKNILMDTFMKDFSEINEPPPIPNDIKEITMVQPSKNNSSLRFLNESVKHKVENPKSLNENNSNFANISTNSKETKLSFLAPAPPPEKKHSYGSDDDKYFELNCETEMFGTNMSMIKNSTWLPNHGPTFSKGNAKQFQQIKEQSIHIKAEEISSNASTSSSTLKAQPEQQVYNRSENSRKSKLSFMEKSLSKNDFSIDISASELVAINAKKVQKHADKTPVVILESPEQHANANDDEDCEMSIYYKHTPKTPKPQLHVWDDADSYKTPAHNHYVHAEPDLNQTHQTIENICIDPNVNPFNVDLINAFLEQHYVISYLESLPTCKLVGCIQRLKQHSTFDINGVHFDVIKLIGEGAYGAVFCGKETCTGKLVAMKQEKPPNYWEYYICLEIQERIRTDEMLPAYMSVDYALIGNNSSILISNFSSYGSLITVCNKIKKHTMKNVDEYVVMLLASELLEIMDHLHAVNIIHADVKADNFLLMNKLTYPPIQRCLQLIDFGVSIDLKLFKQGQTFNFVHNDNSFKCPEMREERPWTYQLDLYGLAGVLHVLLFGKYMDIEKKARGFWMHKTHVPRYINKNLWDEVFKTLLNIRDCNSMPNLQDLRALLKKEMEEKDKYVLKMVNEFNRALSN